MRWTTPADARSEVQSLWKRGRLLASLVPAAVLGGVDAGEPELIFPHRLKLRRPTNAQIGDEFDAVRNWIRDLSAVEHLRVEMKTTNHRVLGVNDIPIRLWIDSLDNALALIGHVRDANRFRSLIEVTTARRPELLGWLRRRSLRALEHRNEWECLLDVVDWLDDHPKPGIYLRQVGLTGIDSKFIESHRAILSELIDHAIPQAIVDAEATGVRGFAKRYGFTTKPNLIRFRILDPSRQLLGISPDSDSRHLADITLDSDAFATIKPDIDQVFITENEINFLAFPNLANTMVIFGAGYGTERLHSARWLSDCRIRYWGDIDTHGFAVLDEIRSRFDHIESFLMDRQTFEQFEPFWATEPTPETRELNRLTSAEAALYRDLIENHYGTNLRLEQERIDFNWFLNALGT